MHRVRLLALKAHPELTHAFRERILITHFLLGLYNRQLAKFLAVAYIKTAAETERLAVEGEAVTRDVRARRYFNNFLPEEACDEPLVDEDDYLERPQTMKTTTLPPLSPLPARTNAATQLAAQESAAKLP